HQWLHPVFAQAEHTMGLVEHHDHTMELVLMAISVAIGLTGWWFGRSVFLKDPQADRRIAARTGFLYRLLANKYYVDEVYDATVVRPVVKTSDAFMYRFFDVRIIDGIVNGAASVTSWVSRSLRVLQTGIVQNYAAMIVVGIVLVLGLLIFS
ncbi:MAG: NADH-quinone oxidoreductase subunit L, partial [Bacteroidetes bacterium]|nr:NADH-quinone oxidoreductase subunit L [Bacteroidota bacterium]